jgi:predicted nucleic acid-binding protein
MAVKKARPNDEPQFAGGSDIRYIETSALIAAVVEGDKAADEAIRGEGRRIASVLTFGEARRTIARLGVTGRMTSRLQRTTLGRLKKLESYLDLVAIGAEVLERTAKPFPIEPVRSLDAIHLATAELLDASPQAVTIVTRDRRVAQNARAMGFVVE